VRKWHCLVAVAERLVNANPFSSLSRGAKDACQQKYCDWAESSTEVCVPIAGRYAVIAKE
jgi:poly-beta-hydroxyalkanoate depolymerase